MLVTSIYGGYASKASWYKACTELAIKFLLTEKVEISTSGSEGGYLFISEAKRTDGGQPKLLELVACGNFPTEKNGAYMYNSIEKGARLNTHVVPCRTTGHMTSRQSANSENQEYAGAIYDEISNVLFSFSGLKSEWDEFVSVLTSCFHYYMEKQKDYPIYIKLEDLFILYRKRADLITATPEQKSIMLQTAEKVINYHIKLRSAA